MVERSENQKWKSDWGHRYKRCSKKWATDSGG